MDFYTQQEYKIRGWSFHRCSCSAVKDVSRQDLLKIHTLEQAPVSSGSSEVPRPRGLWATSWEEAGWGVSDTAKSLWQWSAGAGEMHHSGEQGALACFPKGAGSLAPLNLHPAERPRETVIYV